MKFTFLSCLIFFALVLAGCQTTSDAGEPVDQDMIDQIEETVDDVKEEMGLNESKKGMLAESLLGTVTYLDLEGGFYGIVGEDGNKYLPLNLTEEFQQDSLQVRFTYQRREGVMTIAMWGQAVDITAIERAE